MLADEPTGNLDAEAGAAVLALLRGAADDGRAVVLVTHDEAATSAADRVLRLVDGRLERREARAGWPSRACCSPRRWRAPR